MVEQTPPPPAGLTRRGLEARIIAKAWRDPLYAQHLASDPKSVLQHEIAAIDPSITLPETLRVHVHRETPSDYHLVLPRNPKDVSLEEVIGDGHEAIAPQTVAVALVNSLVTSAVQVVVSLQVVNAVANAVLVMDATQVASSISALNATVVSNVIA